MAAGHALRGMASAWLGLIVLQAVSTQGGSGRVAGLFTDLDNLLQRAMNPDVPAIPDRRAGASTPTGSPSVAPAPAPLSPVQATPLFPNRVVQVNPNGQIRVP